MVALVLGLSVHPNLCEDVVVCEEHVQRRGPERCRKCAHHFACGPHPHRADRGALGRRQLRGELDIPVLKSTQCAWKRPPDWAFAPTGQEYLWNPAVPRGQRVESPTPLDPPPTTKNPLCIQQGGWGRVFGSIIANLLFFFNCDPEKYL